MTDIVTPKKRRGFACLTPEKRAEISAKGGKAAHEQGTAHEFTADEAREAGRKGGIACGRIRQKARFEKENELGKDVD